MAYTRANIQEMLQALDHLEGTLAGLNRAADDAENALNSIRTAWQSSDAAPAFAQKVTIWQNDHQELIQLTKGLIPLLEAAKDDLQHAEKQLTV